MRLLRLAGVSGRRWTGRCSNRLRRCCTRGISSGRGSCCGYGCGLLSRGSSNDERVLADWTVVAGVALVLLNGRLFLHLVVEAVRAEVLGIDLESESSNDPSPFRKADQLTKYLMKNAFLALEREGFAVLAVVEIAQWFDPLATARVLDFLDVD